MACVPGSNGNAKAGDVPRLEAEILALRQRISSLNGLKQEPPRALEAAYVAVLNDMGVLARSHCVAYTINMPGDSAGDLEHNARPSDQRGLREVLVRGVFSGFQRCDTWLSLLEAFYFLEKDLPVLVQSVDLEKDNLVFDLVIVGL